MKKTKKYWKGIEELNKEPEFEKNKVKEFGDYLPFDEGILKENGVKADRREFLKMFGFGMAAVSLASCEMPVKKAIPYLNKPEEITPGVANWYASTYSQGGDYCGILVKTREGRPIKIEGNPESITKGGVSARVHASVLDLYDITRLKNPLKGGNDATWQEVDKEIMEKLNTIKEKNGNVVIVSSSIISPTTKQIINDFVNHSASRPSDVTGETSPTTRHVTYDAISCSGMINANKDCFEKPTIPTYHFEKANTILSIECDFLGSWLSPVQFTKQYVQNRKPEKKKMSRHIQLETRLSLTGASADFRVPIKPSQVGPVITNLYNAIAVLAEAQPLTFNAEKFELAGNAIKNSAKELWDNRGKSLVVCGSNDPYIQILVNAINVLLENYGNTIDLDNPTHLKQGIDNEFTELISQMNNGIVDAIILYDANPVYHYPKSKEFVDALKKVDLKISLAGKKDETASLVDYVCPDHHYLESWNDAEPSKGIYGICQPTINPIFNTRPAQESLMLWAGHDHEYLEAIKDYWAENIFPKQNKYLTFSTFWNSSVHDGIFELPQEIAQAYEIKIDISMAGDRNAPKYSTSSKKTELILYEKVAIGDGRSANNPWLQELPDPISKVTWDNYVAIAPKYAEEMGLKQEDLVKVAANGNTVELPVVVQPGQAYGTVAIAVGYGRTMAGKTGDNVGKNASPLAAADNTVHLMNMDVTVTHSEGQYPLAQTQTHDTLVGRPIIKETTLGEYVNNPASGNEDREKIKKSLVTLYEKFEPEGHHWAMVIDLNACTGCGACVVSCSAENNVPVVGKNEVRMRREMHWLRIDRYYSESASDDHAAETDNPDVTFQPMLCQHCDNAPCENVCPVAATNHSSEGINQMAYNRCIGTRYCANNCPYKVRRFNWFDYADNDSFPGNTKGIWDGEGDSWGMTKDLPRMALNPDVVVRSRGVMEKCTFCIQRIQGAKLEAKKDERDVKDGEVKTACQQSCPADAIKFGDLLDPNSEVSKLYKNERMYHVLEELHVLPSIGYLTQVRNKKETDKKA